MANPIETARTRPLTVVLLLALGGLTAGAARAWARDRQAQPDIDAQTRRRLGRRARTVEPSAADIHVVPAQYGH